MWVAVPRDGQRKGEEEEEGGRALQGNGERKDLPASRVKHCMIQATVGGGRSGQEGKGMERGEAQHEWRKSLWTARDSRGEVEGVTEQGGVEG